MSKAEKYLAKIMAVAFVVEFGAAQYLLNKVTYVNSTIEFLDATSWLLLVCAGSLVVALIINRIKEIRKERRA